MENVTHTAARKDRPMARDGCLPFDKLLVVTPQYLPRHVGGTELNARSLAQWVCSHGGQAEVVCVEEMVHGDRDAVLGAQQELFEGVTVHRLRLMYCTWPSGFRASFDHPEVAAYIDRVIKQSRPDVVHLISGYLVTGCALTVAGERAVPSVVTLDDYWFLCPRINLIRPNGQPCGGPHNALDCTRCLLSESRRYRWPERAAPRLARLAWRVTESRPFLMERLPLHREIVERQKFLVGLLNHADACVIPTESLRPSLVRAGVTANLDLVRHGIAAEGLGIEPGHLKTPSADMRFGYLGNLLFSKGADLLLEAFGSLATGYPGISLALCGGVGQQAGYTRRLQRQIATLPRVRQQGPYDLSQIGELLRSIDVLVVPSRWPETGPFVILEAFAAQTPVIAARIGNMPELVKHGVNGLLFEPDSAAGLEHEMRRLLEEKGLYDHLRSGIGPIRTKEREIGEYAAVYRRVLEGSSRSGYAGPAEQGDRCR